MKYGADLLASEIAGALSRQTPTVLDVGCGDGTLSAALAQTGFSVRGVDILPFSPSIITKNEEIAHVLCFHRASAVEILRGGFQEGNIVFCRSLHHMDIEQVLALAARRVSPGGSIVVVDIAAACRLSTQAYCVSHTALLVADIVKRAALFRLFSASFCIKVLLDNLRYFVGRAGRSHIASDLSSGRPPEKAEWERLLYSTLPGGRLKFLAGNLFIYAWRKDETQTGLV